MATEKKIPASYCLWCEQNLATKDKYPYCSQFCKTQAFVKDKKGNENASW